MLKALWTSIYDARYEDYFNQEFDIQKGGPCKTGVVDYASIIKDDELLEAVKDKDVLILGFENITKEVIEAAPDLKLIMSERDGPEENIDIQACTEAGIPVISAAGRCAESVAEHCLTQMMALSRKIVYLNNNFKKDGWEFASTANYDINELYSKTLGLVGFGRNARTLAKMAQAFEMDIIIYDPYVTEEQAKAAGVRKGTLDEVMQQGDYVVLLARVTPETKGLVSAEKIALMKETAFLINSGRSALTDENAIIKAVKEKKIKGAALDVFDYEPYQNATGVKALGYEIDDENLILTPHVAGMSDMRVIHQYENMIDGWKSFSNGEKTIRLNNPKVFDSPNFAKRGGLVFGFKKKEN